MEQPPQQEYTIDFNSFADTYDSKKELLKYFLQEDSVQYQDGVPVNSNRFLYLYGPVNSGKYTILKEVAKEVYGDNWEQQIYLRQDDGQRYPYKLHAHKVEYSRKIILLTDKTVHWRKWRELYPTTKAFRFEGAEVIPTTQGHVTIRYTEYFEQNKNNNIQMKSDIDQIIASFFQTHNLSEELSLQLRNSIKNRLIEHWRNSVNVFQASEVTNVLV